MNVESKVINLGVSRITETPLDPVITVVVVVVVIGVVVDVVSEVLLVVIVDVVSEVVFVVIVDVVSEVVLVVIAVVGLDVKALVVVEVLPVISLQLAEIAPVPALTHDSGNFFLQSVQHTSPSHDGISKEPLGIGSQPEPLQHKHVQTLTVFATGIYVRVTNPTRTRI